MHGRGSSRAERVCTDVFWGESESGRAHSLSLRPEEGDDGGGAYRADTLRGRLVADCGGRITSMFTQAEEDVGTRLNWAGCQALQSEVRHGLTLGDVLLFFQGEYDMGDMLEPPDWGVGGGGCHRRGRRSP